MRRTPGTEQESSHSAVSTQYDVSHRKGLARTFEALTHKHFLFLWLGDFFHGFGLWVWQIALPLLVLDMGGTAVDLGWVLAARTIPAVLLGMVAGAVADTFNRKAVLLLAKAGAVVTGVAFAALVVGDWALLWHVYVLSLLRGAVAAFDQPARRAIIPSILPERLVTNAITLSMGSVQITRIAGAAGAGLMVATLGLGAAFTISAVMYLLAFVFTAMVMVPDYARNGYQGPAAMVRDFVEGFRFAWRSSSVRGILIVAVVYFTFGASFMQVFAPLLAKDVLEIGNAGFGYMMAMTGVGGLVGALVLATLNPNRGRGLILAGGILAFGVLLALLSLSTYTGSVPLVFVMVGLLGIGQSVVLPMVNGVLLTAAPLEMRGRVMGVISLDRAMISGGSVLAGFAAAAIGPQEAQILFGLLCVVAAGGMLALFTPIRKVD